MVVYQFNCFCEDSYFDTTSRQFGKRVKEHIRKTIDEFSKMYNKENNSKTVVNASQRSVIAEHLIKKPNCASYCNLKRFKTIYKLYSIFDLIKLEDICILLRKT